MDAMDNLKALEQMLKDIMWAPNRAIGTMMKREAELFSKKFARYSNPAADSKLATALDFALKASAVTLDREMFRNTAMASWTAYEQAISYKILNGPEATI